MDELEKTVQQYLKIHRTFFETGKTIDVNFRLKMLQLLREVIQRNEAEIMKALNDDLHKSEFEAYATEIGLVLDSIKFFLKHLKGWSRPKRVRTPLTQFGAASYVYYEPYGTVLIIGPFNYPFQLVIEPLVGAIAAGNCAVLKPSEFTPNVSKIITKMIRETFADEYIRVIEGAREETAALIHASFDYIFFTGSVPVGKIVMEAAAKKLIPVTLELGGKSPCIVDKEANIRVAAERIAWGKFLNAGQTCVAPDYLLVHKDVKQEFLKQMKKTLQDFYGDDALASEDYGRVVNERHMDRLIGLLDSEKIVIGGQYNKSKLYIQPTLMVDVSWDDKVMEDEIFGPILPVLEYDDLNELIHRVNSRPRPLAFYVFTENRSIQEKLIRDTSYGGGCINDTISHLATPYLPFGGVGPSGMGAYHGRQSFETFSHRKSILRKTTRWSFRFLYPPYDKKKISLLRRFLK